MKTDAEWARLLYGLLNEGRALVANTTVNRSVDKDVRLWLATVENATREYRAARTGDRVKGKLS